METKKTEYWFVTDPEKDWKGLPAVEVDDDPANRLADLVANTTYDDIPAVEIERAKQGLLDTLAVMTAGSTQRCLPATAECMIKYYGGTKGGSPILFWGINAPATIAALVNGTMGRIMDFGDVHDTGGHISEYVIPAMLTALPLSEKKISGKEFLAAYILGAEWCTRQHTSYRFHYHPMSPGESGHFGQAVSIAKMWGLNRDQILNAAGFSYSMNSIGEAQKVFEASDSQRMMHGFMAKDSISAALMAKNGLTAPHAMYFGKSGIMRFCVWDDVEPWWFDKDLGTYWHWSDGLLIKPFASCKFTHSVIQSMLNIMEQIPDYDWHNIEEIHCIVPPNADPVVQPEAWDPKTVGKAMFSIPYAIAHAAMFGEVGLNAFNDENFNDPVKRELIKHVTVEETRDPEFQIFSNYIVEVTMKDGSKYTDRTNDILGTPANPMGWDKIIAKYNSCVPYCKKELSKETTEKTIYLCQHLEDVEDMNELLDLIR